MPAQSGPVSTALGLEPQVINIADANGVMREARLIQALGNTPAGYDVIPGWFAKTDVKIGQWVWCMNRVNVVDVAAVSGPDHKVQAAIDMEKLARQMAEVKDEHKFEGVVTPPPARAKPYVVKKAVPAGSGKTQGD
ncbi:MAG: hypothetical protein ACRC1H_13125 [Caldilineaceae bacterium]